MEISKILSSDVLDIIFEGRNKDYGAYQLRKTYVKRYLTALALTAAFTMLLYGGMKLSAYFAELNKDKKMKVRDVNLADVKEAKKEEIIKPPPPPPKPPDPPKIEMKKFTPPKVVEDEKVKPEDKPPKQEEMDKSKIGGENIKGKEDDGKIDPPKDEGTGKVPDPTPPKKEEDEIFTKVEKEAEFPGGVAAWRRYLEKNLDANIPVNNGAPEGNHTVYIQFVVDKEGNISQVEPLTSIGFGMEEEAMKIIKKGPKWTPAKQNGNYVKAYHKQPITFVVAGE
jgi:periplasmic protein TonB